MKKIQEFKLIDRLDGYDKLKNPAALAIFELLPVGISWIYDGSEYHRWCEQKLLGVLTNNQNNIALIEAPFNKQANQAYILNPDGSIKWNVGDILRKESGLLIFSDVYYIGDDLYYFAHLTGRDLRFSFDTTTGIPGKMFNSY
jgi:hypothetical protein